MSDMTRTTTSSSSSCCCRSSRMKSAAGFHALPQGRLPPVTMQSSQLQLPLPLLLVLHLLLTSMGQDSLLRHTKQCQLASASLVTNGVLQLSDLSSISSNNGSRALYIVSMSGAAPASVYAASGGIGLFSTDSNRAPLPSDSFLVRSYEQRLRARQQSLLLASGLSPQRIVKSYSFGVNAFSAMLSPQEAESLKEQPQVAAVSRAATLKLLAASPTRSPAFLNLPGTVWREAGGAGRAGEGVVIGVIDSGIWPENPAFSPKGFGAKPSKFKGRCRVSGSWSGCNNKVIGAGYFYDSLLQETGGSIDTSTDYVSPRDAAGHGSNCASIAAGNYNYPIRVGSFSALASGVAPRARLAIYKVAWNVRAAGQLYITGSEGDFLSAVDQAMRDGVDVLSISLGFTKGQYFAISELILLAAFQSGIFTAVAAGNDGPLPPFSSESTIAHPAPWLTTVAASTLDTAEFVRVSLGNGATYWGQSLKGGNGAKYRLRDAAAIPAAGFTAAQSRYCLPNSLNSAAAANAIVLCVRGINALVEKSDEVAAAGGVGTILMNNASVSFIPSGVQHNTPTAHVSFAAGAAIRRYLRLNANPTASIDGLGLRSGAEAPIMATFSSAGPLISPQASSVPALGPTNEILKPDVTAPGVGIWGAWSPKSSENPASFASVSGTSMAAPQVAGLAALVRQRHPRWGPAAVKSALLTTAYGTTNRGGPIRQQSGSVASPFNFGSGHIRAGRVMRPGLVFPSSYGDMVGFLAGINRGITEQYFRAATPLQAAALNLPNIVVAKLRGKRTVYRTVLSVASLARTYRASIVAPAGARVLVYPSAFTIAPGGRKTFAVTFIARAATDQFSFGKLTWTSGDISVKSILGVQPTR